MIEEKELAEVCAKMNRVTILADQLGNRPKRAVRFSGGIGTAQELGGAGRKTHGGKCSSLSDQTGGKKHHYRLVSIEPYGLARVNVFPKEACGFFALSRNTGLMARSYSA
jgi:hypothetical protein